MFTSINVNEFRGVKYWRSDPVYADGDAIISKRLPLPVNGFYIVLYAQARGLEHASNGYRSVVVVNKNDVFDFLNYTYKQPPQFMSFEELSLEQNERIVKESVTLLELYKEEVDRLSPRRKFCLVQE